MVYFYDLHFSLEVFLWQNLYIQKTTMKKYTIHFLIVTVASAILGFTGLEFPGAMLVRLLCLFAGIGLMISCLDAVIVSRKNKRIKKSSELKS